MAKPTVLDMFSGCGGLSLGFENAGYDILMGIDNYYPALETFQNNHSTSATACLDLVNAVPEDASRSITKKVDVIIGGPPCQGFSIAGKRIIDDDRNKLYKSFVEFVGYFKPKAFLMENVPNIVSMANGLIKDAIIEDFQNLGYTTVYKILLASNYGVPQNRRRAIFVGLRGTSTFEFPAPEIGKSTTSLQAISDLPEHSVEDGSPYPYKPSSNYQANMRMNSQGIFNHVITQHNESTIKIISLVPDGGNYKDLPKELHHTRKVNIAWTRLNSSKPSFTIDTGHRHHFHYEFNRVPTVRESARIQSFPDNFIFSGSKTSQYLQVGNAVPPLLAEHLANKLKGYL
jgi:DNA (cytosine-5)-methyltransferase 1